MTIRNLLIATTIAVTSWAASPANAQQAKCMPRAAAIEELSQKWLEARIGYGLVSDGQNVIEVYANPETGTWTMLVATPNGMACLVASGKHWTMPEPEAVGAPA